MPTNLMTKTDYFYVFLQHQIDSGVKQMDIIRSGHVKFSKQYLSKIVQDQPKSISTEHQASIGRYFELTYDEMIEEGKRLYEHSRDDTIATASRKFSSRLSSRTDTTTEGKSKSPLNLIDLATFMQSGIRETYEYIKEVEGERDSLIDLLNSQKTCICVVDAEIKVIYQNPCHKQIFGDLLDKEYTFFWDKSLSRKEILETVTAKTNSYLEKEYNDQNYIVQFSLKYSGHLVDKFIEQVYPQLDRDFKSEKTLRQMEIYLQVFKHLDHGFGFFNKNRELELASNKFGLLNQYNFPDIRPSVDQLLLDLAEKLPSDSMKDISRLKKAYENKEEVNLEINIDGANYNFQSKNITLNGEHLGILLIVRKLL